MITTHIYVTAGCTFEATHQWPQPTPHRDYLGSLHRHLFHVRATVAVTHEARQIECHDLRDRTLAILRYLAAVDDPRAPLTFGPRSCETIAREVASLLAEDYPERFLRVEVLEDGEAGATVELSFR